MNGNRHFLEEQIPMDTCTLYGIMTVVALKNILKSKNKILTNKSFEGYSYTVISDTLGSSFFAFYNTVFNSLESKNFCLKSQLGNRDTFYLIHFTIESILLLKKTVILIKRYYFFYFKKCSFAFLYFYILVSKQKITNI